MTRLGSAAVLAALVAAALSGCADAAAPADDEEAPSGPVRVTCAPARTGTLTDQVSFRGVVTVPQDRDALVAPVVAGRIVEVAVHEGDRVRRGDLVARTEDPTLVAGVIDARARFAGAQASSDAAHAALARAERLLAEGISARRDVEQARALALSADAELAAARGARGLAGAQSGRARLTAPIDGVVVHVFRRVGELADGTPATPIVEIADLSALELVGNVPAADLVRLALDSPAELAADALPGARFEGYVRRIAPTVDVATSLGEVRVALPEGTQLRMGMASAAVVSAGSPRSAVFVPAAAVRRVASGDEEVVVCDGSAGSLVARARTVALGARVGGDVEIVRGLLAGVSIVTSHAAGLDDGTALVVSRSGPAPP